MYLWVSLLVPWKNDFEKLSLPVRACCILAIYLFSNFFQFILKGNIEEVDYMADVLVHLHVPFNYALLEEMGKQHRSTTAFLHSLTKCSAVTSFSFRWKNLLRSLRILVGSHADVPQIRR